MWARRDPWAMATWERPVDAAAAKARASVIRIGQELREARRDRGLSIDAVARATGVSNAEISRVERGLAPKVPVLTLAKMAGAVGLDLSVRLCSGDGVVRDSAQVALLRELRGGLHRSLGWAAEVPIPLPGDRRAWDAVVSGASWRYGIEAETSPRDVQAFQRRVMGKLRDSDLSGVLVVMRGTRRVREFVRVAMVVIGDAYPVPGRVALRRLAAGGDPAGSSLVILPPRRGVRPGPAPPRLREGQVPPVRVLPPG